MRELKFVIVFGLISSTFAVTFNCIFVNDKSLTISLNPYMCSILAVKELESEALTNVTGSHITGKTNENVEAVQIIDCENLKFIPKEMKKIFPNLKGIQLDTCENLTLSDNSLNEYSSLLYFSMRDAKLKTLPSDLFRSTSEIAAIDFSSNEISELSDEFLDNLRTSKNSNLAWINFSGNQCIDESVTVRNDVPQFLDSLKSKCVKEKCSGASRLSHIFSMVPVVLVVVKLI